MRLPGLPVDSIAEKTDTHTEYHRTLSSYLPVYPSKIDIPTLGLKSLRPGWDGPNQQPLGIQPQEKGCNIHVYTPMIPMSKDFKWPEAETKVFHLQTASPKWGNRKETICLAIGSGNGWNHVGIMLESFPDFPFSSKTSKARLGFLFPFFYVRRTQFVLKLIRSGMVWNSKWPAHQCMLAATNSWSNPALLLQFA